MRLNLLAARSRELKLIELIDDLNGPHDEEKIVLMIPYYRNAIAGPSNDMYIYRSAVVVLASHRIDRPME